MKCLPTILTFEIFSMILIFLNEYATLKNVRNLFTASETKGICRYIFIE